MPKPAKVTQEGGKLRGADEKMLLHRRKQMIREAPCEAVRHNGNIYTLIRSPTNVSSCRSTAKCRRRETPSSQPP